MNTHEIALRSMSVSDEELFNHFIDKLDFQTTKGRLTGLELRVCHEPLVYAGLSEYKHVSQIYAAQNRLLINVGEVYSLDLLRKLADRHELNLTTVNSGEIDDMLKDVSAEECYRQYMSAIRDKLSDCRACECSTHIKYLLYSNRVKEACENCRPILSRRITCIEQPYHTEVDIIEYVVISELSGRIR